ncbi:MAG: nitroreductase [Nocardia sp.]|uniref:nitroreductase family protein n=1 Tax=Nocardia sp. TaxID=1821 RepID=UPI00260375E7|nr:nitroreductase family protein [Nocardia sp.]MCU1648045.1 nitroreductase [Nocardia sp.]
MTQISDRADQTSTLERILDDRWACRQFLPDAVPGDTLDRLFRLAQRTPSWANTQPWQVVVTEGAGTDRFRKELLAYIQGGAAPAPDFPFPTEYTGAYKQRRRDCGVQLYDSVGIVKGDHARTMQQFLRNFELFDAPHVAVVTTQAALGIYGALDCGLYINSVLLGAQSLGLAAAPQAALASYSPFLHEYFGLPDNRRVLVGICLGYPDIDHPINSFRTARADLGDAVTRYAD